MPIPKHKKKCGRCKKIKLLTDFHTEKGTNSGKKSWCKVCRALSGELFYKEHAEHLNNKTRERRYGITKEEYDERLINQEGVCAVCGKTNRDGRPLYIDHDHITGEIRGLLCLSCNFAIGHVYNNSVLCRKIADYLDGV